MSYNEKRIERWYFGGLASVGATFITHPLDLMKVLIQTQKEKLPLKSTVAKIVREQGFISLYSGISASVMRQLSYTMARFGIYSVGKNMMDTRQTSRKIMLAGIAGFTAGLIGSPADLVNVRLQNDVKLPPEQRRNYKHAIDGLYRVTKEEGVRNLFSGAFVNAVRGMVMTIGQIAVYEEVKEYMLSKGFEPSNRTYLISSFMAAIAANTITQPLDVVKTRAMNAKPGEYKNVLDVIVKTSHEGPLAFFKGYVPAFVRLAPQTVLMFIFMEQLRCYFGYLREK